VSAAAATVAVAARLPAGAVAVVRDGPRGCWVLEAGAGRSVVDGAPTYLPGFPQEPVDTNGAGDTHTGVLVACRAGGADWATAARRANAAGAIKVTRRGPATAPTAAEIDDFLAAQEA
jgi:sugar/nucleoside kinase (ribokinase family)